MKKVFLSARLRELAARSGRFVEFAGGPGFEALEDLAVQLRAMQLYAHNAHNQTRGENFFADHEFLGGLYKLKQRMAASNEEKEFARGDFLRRAISKFPEAAPVFSPGSSPSFVAPRGREWRAQFLQWARKRKQSQAVMN